MSIEMRMLSKFSFYFVLRIISLSVCDFQREMCDVVKISEQYSLEDIIEEPAYNIFN